MSVKTSGGFRRHSTAIWLLTIMLYLSGCGTVGVTRQLSTSPSRPFDHALMAYAKGQLSDAKKQLRHMAQVSPDDRRMQVLREAIQQEEGEESEDMSAHLTSPPLLTFTPESLSKEILGHNSEILKSLYQVIVARTELREANLQFSPEFSVLTRFHPVGVFSTLSQSVLDGLITRPARMAQAEERLIAALARYAQARETVLHRALGLYLDYLESQEITKIQERAIQVAKERERIAAVLLNYGVLTTTQWKIIKNEHVALKQELTHHQQAMTLVQFSLNALIGRIGKEQLSLMKKSIEVENTEEIQTLLDQAYQQHPEIAEVLAGIEEQTSHKHEVAWSLPRIDLRGTYGVSPRNTNGGFFQGATVGASIDIPLLIWPLSKVQSAREEAFIHVLEMELGRIFAETTINVVRSYQDLQAALQSLDVARETRITQKEEWKDQQVQEQHATEINRLSVLHHQIQYFRAYEQEVSQRFAIQHAALDVQQSTGMPLEDLTFSLTKEQRMADHVVDPEQSGSKKALWVWPPIALDKDLPFFLKFLKVKGIQTVFLGIDPEQLLSQPQALTALIQDLHQHNIIVHAFHKDPSWTIPENQEARAFMHLLIRFNLKQPHDGRFDALHLAVAPHLSPEWTQKKHVALLQQYVDFLVWAKIFLEPFQLPIVVDIPDWYREYTPYDAPVLTEIRSLVDQIAIMVHEPIPGRIPAVLQESGLLSSDTYPINVWVGVHANTVSWTQDKKPLPDHYDAAYNLFIKQLHASLADSPRVEGIAIDNYAHYQNIILSPQFTLNDVMPVKIRQHW